MNTQENQELDDAFKATKIDRLDFSNKYLGWEPNSLYLHLCESKLPLEEALKKYYGYTKWDWCKELAATYEITPECVSKYFKEMKNAINLGELKKKLSKIKSRKIVPKHTFRFFNVFSFLALTKLNKYASPNVLDNSTHYIAKKINSKRYEQVVLFRQNWSGINWTDFCILNAIYSVIADTKPGIDGKYVFTFREIYETLYPQCRWYRLRREDKKKISDMMAVLFFTDKIKVPVQTNIRWDSFKYSLDLEDEEPKYELEDLLGCVRADHGIITVKKRPAFISLAEAQKRIVAIEAKMLSYGKNIKGGEFLKLYIAHQICLAQNPKNNIRQVILIDTLREKLGPGAISHAVINGYMSYLMRQGYISSFSITAKKITWDDASTKNQAVKQKKPNKPNKPNEPNERPLTILKDANKQIIEGAVKPVEIQERENKLREYNLFISKHHITDGTGKTLTTHLRQEFCQGDWHKGGRLYGDKGNWQSLRGAERERIKIDGQETVELDFTSYQVTMLYHLAGCTAPDDCYSLKGVERNLVKHALHIALNAKDETTAIAKVMNDWNEKHPNYQMNWKNVESLLKWIKEAHNPIADKFCSGCGVELQYFDSEIALNIIHSLMQLKIVALPDHDSFIVQKKYRTILFEAMKMQYKNIIGTDNIGIK